MSLIKNLARGTRRQLDLTTAVCQERLLVTHVRHVLAFVDVMSSDLAFDDALDIYVRVLALTPEQGRNVGSRALAALGQRTGLANPVRTDVASLADRELSEPAGEGGRSDALMSRLRRRVRGRVQADLRLRVTLAAARAEDCILETHVDNCLLFARALGDEHQGPEAVELYLETMALPDGISDVIYNRSLRHLADDVLPPLPEGAGVPSGGVAIAKLAS